MSELSDNRSRCSGQIARAAPGPDAGSGAAVCLQPLLVALGASPCPRASRQSVFVGQTRYRQRFDVSTMFIRSSASSCILSGLCAHATITMDGRRRARRRLDMRRPMSAHVSQGLPLLANNVAALTRSLRDGLCLVRLD